MMRQIQLTFEEKLNGGSRADGQRHGISRVLDSKIRLLKDFLGTDVESIFQF